MPVNSFTRSVDTLVTTTLDKRIEYWTDNIFKEYPALNKFSEKRVTADGGLRIEIPVEYDATETAKALASDLETVTSVKPDPGSFAFYNWATVADGIAIPDNAVSDNAGNEKVLDYVEFLMDNWEHRYKKKLTTFLWASSPASTDPNSIPGLISTTPSTPTTIGNISSSANSWWRSQQTTSGSFATQGMADIRKTYNNCSTGQNSLMPDLIITEQAGFENFEAHLSARERITLDEKGRKSQEVGYERLWFKRAEVVWDAQIINAGSATDSRWYFLNTDFIKFWVEKGRWFRRGPMLRPVDQLGYSVLLDSRFQLCVMALRHQGVLSSVTYP